MIKILSKLRQSNQKAFTLIESLAVIAIIGILASLSIYTITQAQRQARDAVRKSDVSAIAQGFEARALDKTCAPADIGLYPGKELVTPDVRMIWWPVAVLEDSSLDTCNVFGTYLSSIPEDPRGVNHYFFNLSAGKDILAKHYRVAALLERELNDSQQKELCRQSDVWRDEFVGTHYSDCDNGGYLPPDPKAQCEDTVDNDSDGKIDFPDDPGCTEATDDDETDGIMPPPPPPPAEAQCEDTIDNDSDGKIDFPDDPGCTEATDDDETDMSGGGVGPIMFNLFTQTAYAVEAWCQNVEPGDPGFDPDCETSGGSSGGGIGGGGEAASHLLYNYYIGR